MFDRPARRARRTETVAAVCRRWRKRYRRLGFGKRAATAPNGQGKGPSVFFNSEDQ